VEHKTYGMALLRRFYELAMSNSGKETTNESKTAVL
jgi:hypothetical protein